MRSVDYHANGGELCKTAFATIGIVVHVFIHVDYHSNGGEFCKNAFATIGMVVHIQHRQHSASILGKFVICEFEREMRGLAKPVKVYCSPLIKLRSLEKTGCRIARTTFGQRIQAFFQRLRSTIGDRILRAQSGNASHVRRRK